MSLQKIIKESVEKNPLGLKEALEEELRNRIALALEAKMKEEDEDEDEDDDDDELDELDEDKNAKVGLNGKEGDEVYLDGNTKLLYKIVSVRPIINHPVAGKMRMYEIILASGSPRRQTGFYSGDSLTYAK